MQARVINRIAGFLVFVAAAGLAAVMLALFAHDELGLSRQSIRSDALVSALLTASLLVIAVLSQRLGRRK